MGKFPGRLSLGQFCQLTPLPAISMSSITFVFFTYNEEKRLPFILRNFAKYGRICIMDGGSTDRTRQIAENAGADFFSRPPSTQANVETQQNFEFIKNFLKTDWIYWGYVDNFAPRSLLEKLTEISQHAHFRYVLLPLYTYLWGNTEHYAVKGYAPFFFHKDFVDFTGNHIHGIGKFTGTKEQILKLPNRAEYALKHFSSYNLEKFVRNHLRYAEQEAQEKFQDCQKFSAWRLVRALAAYAWIIGKRSYRNGKLGLLVTLNYLSYRVMCYTRLYELEHGITLQSVEDNYSKKREQLLEEFK